MFLNLNKQVNIERNNLCFGWENQNRATVNEVGVTNLGQYDQVIMKTIGLHQNAANYRREWIATGMEVWVDQLFKRSREASRAPKGAKEPTAEWAACHSWGLLTLPCQGQVLGTRSLGLASLHACIPGLELHQRHHHKIYTSQSGTLKSDCSPTSSNHCLLQIHPWALSGDARQVNASTLGRIVAGQPCLWEIYSNVY